MVCLSYKNILNRTALQRTKSCPCICFCPMQLWTEFIPNCGTIYFPEVKMIQCVSCAFFFSCESCRQNKLAGGHIYRGGFYRKSFLPSCRASSKTCWQTLKWTAWFSFLATTQFLPCRATNGEQYQSSCGLHNDGLCLGGMLNPDSGALGRLNQHCWKNCRRLSHVNLR